MGLKLQNTLASSLVKRESIMAPWKTCLAVAAMILLSSLLCARAQKAAGEAPPADEPRTFRVQTNMVSFAVAVTGQDGAHIGDLKKEDFRIFENNIPQQIAGFAAVEEPISVALLLDTSGSTELQLSRIRNEAARFIRLLRAEDSVALLSFADEVTLLEPFNLYHKKNTDALRLIKPGGLSAVYEAVWLSLEQVLKLEYGRKALVILSDGVDTRSETVTRQETLELARKTDATIYSIYFNTTKDRNKRIPRGFDPLRTGPRHSILASQWPPLPVPRGEPSEYVAGRQYLQDLSQYSGGLFVNASKLDNLNSAFRKIAQELWNQYSIGYYPKDLRHDGRFREVTVQVKRPGLTVRTRKGFYDF